MRCGLGRDLHLLPPMLPLDGGRRRRRRQQVSDWVIEAREVDRDPGAQEDGVAQQRLVLEGGPEAAVGAAVHARPQRLR